MTPDVITAAPLAGVPHGFLGRRGGVSSGPYASLNVGTGSPDDPALVERNRQIAAKAVLPGASLATVYQVHSARVERVVAPWPLDSRPDADAMVTDRPGVLLGILTADCGPVLLADLQAGVVGAAHAGWRGAIGGVTDATIAAMEDLGANRSRIAAAVGPCIAQASYEVDEGFLVRFCEEDAANERFFKPGKPGHQQFDLAGYIAARLAAAGIGTVAITGHDTLADEERFFSYRRATLAHKAGAADMAAGAYGRQISLIGLAG